MILAGGIFLILLAGQPGPVHESFTDPGLPGWNIHASGNARIEARDGALEIRAHAHTYAHIERPIEGDRVTVSARIRLAEGEGGASWAPSVFFYWDAGSWLQAGVREGRFYALMMVDGRPWERLFGDAPPGQNHGVELVLGADVIRFSGTPGAHRSFAHLPSPDPVRRIAGPVRPRPKELLGAPRLLIAGKGYGTGKPPHEAPSLDNDYHEPGGVGTVVMDVLSITETLSGLLHMTDAERARVEAEDTIKAPADILGERILALPGDPSYRSVWRIFPALKHSRTAVGVPEHPMEIVVLGDGAIEFAGKRIVSHVHSDRSFGSIISVPTPRRTPRLREGWLPVLGHDWEHAAQTVFGWSEGMSPEKPLSACIRISTGCHKLLPVQVHVDVDGKTVLASERHVPASIAVDSSGKASWIEEE